MKRQIRPIKKFIEENIVEENKMNHVEGIQVITPMEQNKIEIHGFGNEEFTTDSERIEDIIRCESR